MILHQVFLLLISIYRILHKTNIFKFIMLRRTFISLKAGDFVLTLPNENVYRSIFTLANPPEEGQPVNETESLARSIVTRAKDLASSTRSNNNNNNKLFTPSHSPALVTSNVLFSSPLFQLSGVPTSTQEPETLFVWSPVTSSRPLDEPP